MEEGEKRAAEGVAMARARARLSTLSLPRNSESDRDESREREAPRIRVNASVINLAGTRCHCTLGGSVHMCVKDILNIFSRGLEIAQ